MWPAGCVVWAYTSPMRWLLLLALLAGCSDPPDTKPAKRDRQRAAQEAMAKPPVTKFYRIGENALQVIELPVQDTSGFVDIQRCFVWRDAEFRTASISCNQLPDLTLTN